MENCFLTREWWDKADPRSQTELKRRHSHPLQRVELVQPLLTGQMLPGELCEAIWWVFRYSSILKQWPRWLSFLYSSGGDASLKELRLLIQIVSAGHSSSGISSTDQESRNILEKVKANFVIMVAARTKQLSAEPQIHTFHDKTSN